jgi:hypothetical protein
MKMTKFPYLTLLGVMITAPCLSASDQAGARTYDTERFQTTTIESLKSVSDYSETILTASHTSIDSKKDDYNLFSHRSRRTRGRNLRLPRARSAC